MRHSLPSGFAPWPRGRSLRVPKLSLRAEMALQAYQGLPVFLSGAHSGFAPAIGLTLMLRWGLPLTPPGQRSEVDEPRLRDGQPPLLLPGQRSCQPHGLFFWPFLGGLHAGPRAHLDGGGLEPHRALSTVLDTVPAALGTSERESDGEASGSAGSALVNTPSRARPGGQDSSGPHVALWEVSPSAWPWGPGEECLRVPSFLVSGPQEQTLGALPGGWRRREKGLGAVCPCPRRPFPSPVRAQSWAQRAGPVATWGETHREAVLGSMVFLPGSRFQNAASWAPSGPWEPGVHGVRLCKGKSATHPFPTPSSASLFLRGRGQGSAPVPPRENPRP